MVAAVAALLCANSPLAPYYEKLLGLTGELRIEEFSVSKPVLLWINDLWMAIFFFLVGLELKRELVEGELSDRSQLVLGVWRSYGRLASPSRRFPQARSGTSVALVQAGVADHGGRRRLPA